MSSELSCLPDLVLNQALSLICLRERIKLRSVCKRWYFLIERLKQKSLGFYGTSFPRIDLCSRKPNGNDLLRIGCANPILNLETVFFQNVDYLYLFAILEPNNLLAKLNQLANLKELTICGFAFKSVKLKLPNLQTFVLKNSRFELLELDAQKLTTFIYWGAFRSHQSSAVHFVFPETIRVLEYKSYIFKHNLSEFCNLEQLTCVHDSRLPFDIENLSKLKILDLVSIGEPIVINRTDLKVTSAGIENFSYTLNRFNGMLMGEDLVSEYNAQLNPVPFEVFFFFIEFEMSFENGLPESFFRKFPYIDYLSVTRLSKLNPSDLLEFLKKVAVPG